MPGDQHGDEGDRAGAKASQTVGDEESDKAHRLENERVALMNGGKSISKQTKNTRKRDKKAMRAKSRFTESKPVLCIRNLFLGSCGYRS
jgi:hypothetical protein